MYQRHPEGARAKQDRRGAHWRGGVHWFARRVHRTPRAVHYWISGQRPVDPLALDMLKTLEREAGIAVDAGDGPDSGRNGAGGASRDGATG